MFPLIEVNIENSLGMLILMINFVFIFKLNEWNSVSKKKTFPTKKYYEN